MDEHTQGKDRWRLKPWHALAYLAAVRRRTQAQKENFRSDEVADHVGGESQAMLTLDLFSRVNLAPRLSPPMSELWSKDLRHRMRVLLHTLPLTDLHRNQGLAQPEYRHYDPLALAMKTLDLIVESMGLEQEVDRNTVGRALRPLLSAMDSAHGLVPDASRHLAMTERLLDALRNDGNRRHPFQIDYLDLDANGSATKRVLEFRLIEDRHHPIAGSVLRLSNEAINLFLGAFELDIEDAQAAAEAVVRSQLDRGKFHEAVQSARSALLQTLRMQDKIQGLLKQTARDISRVDWREHAPRLLDEAVEHVIRRVGVEQSIQETAEERLSALRPDHDQAVPLRQVIDIIRRCRLRHLDLQDHLMRASRVFLDEQARQSFSFLSVRGMPELGREVLEPLLDMSTRDADSILDSVVPGFLGPIPPSVLSLRSLVGWQLQPRREFVRGEVLIEAPELVTYGEEEARFADATYERAESIFRSITEPMRLSAVLNQAASASEAPELPMLLALRVLQEFAPEESPASESGLVIEPFSAWFEAAGLCGDELLLYPVSLPGSDEERNHL
jgi:hypothetical protein